MFMLLLVHVGVYGHVLLLVCCLYLFGLSCFWPSCIREFVMVCVCVCLVELLAVEFFCGARPPIPHRFLTCAFTTVASWGMFVWGGRGVVSPLGHPQLVYYYISILRMISQPPECDHEIIENIGRERISAA